MNYQQYHILGKSTPLQIIIFLAIIMFMGNLDALLDSFLHPEIPYFDPEHLIIGGVTSLVSLILFGLSILYVRHLDRALGKIELLERFIPICAYCKRVRKPASDPYDMTSWEPIETFVKERTTARFTHGICPECAGKLNLHIHKLTGHDKPKDT
jgi:hypothetical protein